MYREWVNAAGTLSKYAIELLRVITDDSLGAILELFYPFNWLFLGRSGGVNSYTVRLDGDFVYGDDKGGERDFWSRFVNHCWLRLKVTRVQWWYRVRL